MGVGDDADMGLGGWGVEVGTGILGVAGEREQRWGGGGVMESAFRGCMSYACLSAPWSPVFLDLLSFSE